MLDCLWSCCAIAVVALVAPFYAAGTLVAVADIAPFFAAVEIVAAEVIFS